MKITLPSGLRSITIAALVGALALLAGWASAAEEKKTSAILTSGGSNSIRALTPDEFLRDAGRWPLTRSELEEILKAMTLLWGQAEPEIVTVEQAVLLSESARHRRIADRIEQREKDRAWAMEVMNKWRERGRKLRD